MNRRFYEVTMLVLAEDNIPPFTANGENEPTSFFRLLCKAIKKPGLTIVDSDVNVMTEEEAVIKGHCVGLWKVWP